MREPWNNRFATGKKELAHVFSDWRIVTYGGCVDTSNENNSWDERSTFRFSKCGLLQEE